MHFSCTALTQMNRNQELDEQETRRLNTCCTTVSSRVQMYTNPSWTMAAEAPSEPTSGLISASLDSTPISLSLPQLRQ